MVPNPGDGEGLEDFHDESCLAVSTVTERALWHPQESFLELEVLINPLGTHCQHGMAMGRCPEVSGDVDHGLRLLKLVPDLIQVQLIVGVNDLHSLVPGGDEEICNGWVACQGQLLELIPHQC